MRFGSRRVLFGGSLEGESFSYSKSLLLDGTNERVNFTDTTGSPLDITNNFSMSAWVKTSSTNNLMAILNKRFNSAGDDSYQIYLDAGRPVFFLSATGSTNSKRFRINTDIRDGNWHMVTATFFNNDFKCYLDGVEATGADLSPLQNNVFNTFHAGNLPLNIGALNNIWWFDGNITGVSLWDTAILTDTEISELYNGGSPSIEPGKDSFAARCVFHLDFNQPGDDATSGTGQITDSVSGLVGAPDNTEVGDIVEDGPN